MENFYYVLKDSSNSLLRNKGATFFKTSFSLLYFLVLITVLHSWLTVIHLGKLEKQKMLEEINSLESLIHSDASKNLLTLLSSLNTVLLIFSIGLFLFGILYLFVYFHRTRIIDQKELIIKKMLGASALQVTTELFIEPLLIIIPTYIFSLFTIKLLYRLFFQFSDSWLTSVLPPLSYFVLYVDFPLIGIFALILIYQFLYLKQKITNL